MPEYGTIEWCEATLAECKRLLANIEELEKMHNPFV